ncbi:hypothetical protein OOK60_16215 [Trichothermofontia sichuanensis B231]|uniref:hypothetical protein n=1 Tax=Trichothermofontia sichuanensis TaxID=3045816 RepID=UPI002246D721|nr:hypothetical protein [Trichothermofontia sichuanensis]UZQ54016.1 hypothetical protein OOK60_16215 [Trichothermofontia sichuanensis B231]
MAPITAPSKPQSSLSPAEQLQTCLSLAADLEQRAAAEAIFEQLRDRVSGDREEASALMNCLWKELIAARHSASFWRKVADVEKEISERLAASHAQLQQNHIRLVQEQ